MMEYKVKTYEEAVDVIEKVGILPLAPLIPDFPSLNTITLPEHWHSDTEFDPWTWRTKFATDGVAAYGKFIKKKSILVSRELLPYVKNVLGYTDSVEERYFNGNISTEARALYKLISQEEGIDTRALRIKAGLKEKEKKKLFDHALLELQGSMDIVISGTQVKRNAEGEKNGWSSTAYETYDTWAARNSINVINEGKEDTRKYLLDFYKNVCSDVAMKKLERILV